MISQSLLDKSRVEIKLGQYAVATATSLTDPSILPRVQDYRRLTGSRMYPIDALEIGKRIPSADYHVSRKVDGEFTVFVYRDGEAFSLNPGGTIRLGLPWHEDAAQLLVAANVKEAMIAGELYVNVAEDRRPRVHDVTKMARQPKSDDDLSRLHFAVFDIISWNESPPPSEFPETWKIIQDTFANSPRVHPVEAVSAKDAAGVEKIFADWVDGEGAEGLVLRSDSAGIFKVKRRHTIDAAVIGFTESSDDRQGMMHDLLLAVMRNDGTLHVLSRVGGGFSDDDRRSMLSDLKDMIVESEYAEVNSDHVAYQMVRPEWVVEISCLDLISQTTRGGPVNRMVLNWNRDDGSGRYEVIRRLPLVSVISPQFIRRREDKTVHPTDTRISQIANLVEVPLVDREAGQMTLPKGEILRRDVYTKILKGETMVRKFLMWKTNKENESEEFPAYVVHYTDFSPNRKSPLARDVRISNSREQIDLLWEGLVEANIKQGWSILSPVGQLAVKADARSKTEKKSKPSQASKKTKSEKPAGKPKKKAAVKKAAVKKAATAKKATAKKETGTKATAKKKTPKPKSPAPKKSTATKKAAPKKTAGKQPSTKKNTKTKD